MKKNFYRLAIAVFTLLSCEFMSAADAPSGIRETITVGGKSRTYEIYCPNGLAKNRPLLMSCHGMGQDINYQKNQARWDLVADTAKFLVVYPAGTNNSWDVGGTSDTDFLSAIIDEMYKKYGIDKNRVYLSGFSMGSMLTYHAMTKIGDKIAAFGPVSGYPRFGMTATSTRPIPICHVHGDADDVLPFEPGSDGAGTLVGVMDGINKWVKRNNCNPTAKESKVNGCTTKYEWTGGDCDANITLYKIAGKGHWHSNDDNCLQSSRAIWQFVSQYTLECGKQGGGSTPAMSVSISLSSNIVEVGDELQVTAVLPEGTKIGGDDNLIEFVMDGEKQTNWSTNARKYTVESAGLHTLVVNVLSKVGSNFEQTATADTTFIGCEARAAYNGTPIELPGVLETEEFDLGCKGTTYYDDDEKNQGDANIRTDAVGVDIVTVPDGYAIGYTSDGEWWAYTVDVKTAGEYEYEATVSSGLENSGFHFQKGGTMLTDKIVVPKGEDWDTYTTVKGKLIAPLEAGEQSIRLVIDGGYCNIDKVVFKKAASSGVEDIYNEGTKTYDIYTTLGTYVKSIEVDLNNIRALKNVLTTGVYVAKDRETKSGKTIIITGE